MECPILDVIVSGAAINIIISNEFFADHFNPYLEGLYIVIKILIVCAILADKRLIEV